MQVIRNYHGHLSGVYTLALHPTLPLLMTGGRDSAVRVWDIRTRLQVSVPPKQWMFPCQQMFLCFPVTVFPCHFLFGCRWDVTKMGRYKNSRTVFYNPGSINTVLSEIRKIVVTIPE